MLLNPYRFGGGGGGDPNFADLILLNNHQGTNGSTTFTDASPVGRTLTAQANAQISTAQAIFGTSSALFDGAGDYVSMGTNINLADTVEWSVGMWFRPDESSSVNASFDHLQMYVNSGGNDRIVAPFYYTTALASRSLFGFADAGSFLQEGVTDLVANTWYYLLLANDPTGNVFQWWLGNTGLGGMVSQNTSTKKGLQMSHYAAFGNPPPNNEYKGYIGPMRVYSGYAETPVLPTGLFPES